MPNTKAKTSDINDGYRLLASAVVEAAARDYEAGYRLRNVKGLDSYNYTSAREFLLSDRLKLFTDIDQLTEGDVFVLTVLNHEATYEVDQILTVLPDEMQSLAITPEQDYCTLVTCTPYGVNTHRLLIRGHRIPNIEKPEKDTLVPTIPATDEYAWVPHWIRETPIFILAPAGTMALIILIFLLRLVGRVFRKKKR